MKIDWELIKKPENMPYGITILIALLVAVLSFLKVVSVEVLIAAVLLVISSIISLLIILHSSIRELQKDLKTPSIEKNFSPFHEMRDDIRLHIKRAAEIWLLTRTGQRFVNETFRREFKSIIEGGKKVCFLFLDPKDNASKMVAKHLGKNPTNEKTSAEQFLDGLRTKYGNKIDLKVIDYLPAWTLIIINPKKGNGESVIYVELATYHADAEERPTFKVTSDETKSFNMFLNEFKDMCNDSTNWEIRKLRKVN